MLCKLTRYELKKLVGGKFFLIALCVLLAANAFLLCGLREYVETREELERIGFPLDQSFWELRGDQVRWTSNTRESYGVLADLTPEERTAFENAMKDKYGEDALDPFFECPPEMMAPPGYFGEAWPDSVLAANYWNMRNKNSEHRALMEKTVTASQGFGREALAAGDNYGIRRNLQIIRLYSVPREETAYPVISWDEFLFETPTMLFVFLMVLLLCAGSFSGERDRQTWLLLHTAKNGKGKTLLAKYLAGAMGAAGLTVLFQAASFAMILWKKGFLGAGEPVFALEALRVFPYPFTVWQYALLTLGCQIFTAVVLSVLVNTVSALSRSGVIAYATAAVLLGICLLAVYIPPKSEWLAGPLALSQPLHYFDSYYTADIFGFPVLWAVVQAVLWSIAGGLCVFAAHKVYHRKGRAV